MPTILDLYCGAGGAAMGYHRAGFDVVGVDVAPQPNYPFFFIQADAIEVLNDREAMPGWWDTFSAVHASPPCQAYSTLAALHDKDYPDLYEPTRELLIATGLPYVIENVIGAPYRSGFVLCGSMFGLKVRRHRNFESSELMFPPKCDHRAQGTPLGVYGHGGGGKMTRGTKAKPSQFAELMGMPWAKPAEIVQAIPPVYTEWIGSRLLEQLERVA